MDLALVPATKSEDRIRGASLSARAMPSSVCSPACLEALYRFTGLKSGAGAGPPFQETPVFLQDVESQYCPCDRVIQTCSSVC